MLSKKQNKKQKNSQLRVERLKESGYTSWNRQYPIAPRTRTWLRYAEAITGLGGAPTQFDYQFRLNSLFDPNFTGAGHQPRGFDQLAALYGRYRVYRARVRVIMQLEQSGIANVVGTIFASNSSNGSAAFNDSCEQPFSSTSGLSEYQMADLKLNVDLAKVNGKTWEAYASDDTTQADVASNPTEIINLHVTAASPSASAITVSISVIIDYDVEFSDIKQLASS